MFITDINRVIRRGECEIPQSGSPNYASLSVEFEVTAQVFVPGEILVGCEVTSTYNGNLTLKKNNCTILIKSDKQHALQNGDKTIVSVIRFQCNINSDHIFILGELFTLPTVDPVYKLEKFIPVNGEFDAIIEQLDEAEKRKEHMLSDNTRAKMWAIHNTHVFGLNEIVPKNAKSIPLMELIEGKYVGNIGTNAFVNPTKKVVYNYGDNVKVNQYTTPKEAINAMIMNYVRYINLVCDCVDWFPTIEDIKKNDRQWKFMLKSRK